MYIFINFFEIFEEKNIYLNTLYLFYFYIIILPRIYNSV